MNFDHGLFDPEEEPEHQEDEDPEARKILLEELKTIYRTRRRIKRRNELLKRCLKEFFKKRKLDHLCKEQDSSSAEIEAAYENKLSNYAKVKLSNLNQIEEKRREEATLEVEKSAMEEKWREVFEKLKQVEVEKAMHLAVEWKKKKRENMLKKLSKIIDSQLSAYETEGEARSAEIKLREQIRAQESKLKRMDNISEDIQIYDYERVQADNARIQSKIDDKISELRKIETNNQAYREKISQLRQKIAIVIRRTHDVSTNVLASRRTLQMTSSNLNQSITSRNRNLRTAQHLTESAGLNLYPRLLTDYEQRHSTLIQTNAQIDTLKANLSEITEKIAKLNSLQSENGGKLPAGSDEKSEKSARPDFVDRFRLTRTKCNYWSRSKSRSSDDSSTVLSNLSASFHAKKLQLLDISAIDN